MLPPLFSASDSINGVGHGKNFISDSPDSGKGKEMSSESISDAFLPHIPDQQLNNSWAKNNNSNIDSQSASILDDLTTQSISFTDAVTVYASHPCVLH